MIDALADICRNNLYTNKLLLVPSYTVGQNIIRTLADKAPVLNLKIETIQGITTQIGMPLLNADNTTLADDNISRYIMFCIIYSMPPGTDLSFLRFLRRFV
jgi:hypothetical protein